VEGDPINHYDPAGEFSVAVGSYTWSGNDMSGCINFFDQLYSSSSQVQSLLGSGGVQAINSICLYVPLAAAAAEAAAAAA